MGILQYRRTVERYISSVWFNSVMGILIIANLFYIGIESDFRQSGNNNCSVTGNNSAPPTINTALDPESDVWYTFDTVFASVFIAEIVLRVFAGGLKFFKSFENIMDLGLVASGSVDVWILSHSSDCSNAAAGQSVKILTALRIVRIMRVIRFFRLMKSFGQIRLIVTGLFNSLKTLVWVFVFLTVLIYMSAIFTTTQLGSISNKFSSIPDSMLTLFQITTLDSWADEIVRPVVHAYPYAIIFFVMYIFFTSFGLINIVLGIVVENTIISANDKKAREMREKEVMKQAAIASIRDLLDSCVVKGTTTLSKEDFALCLKVPEICKRWDILELPDSILSILFPSETEVISIEDIVSICAQTSMSVSPSGLLDIIHDLEGLRAAVVHVSDIVQDVHTSRQKILGRLDLLKTHSLYYLIGETCVE
jgi:voltage-gated sodium channel